MKTNKEFIRWCDINKVKYTLDKGGEIIAFDKETINNKDDDGGTPLMAACWQDDIGMVKLLLRYGVDINAKDNEGFTALSQTCHQGNYNIKDIIIVRWLLSYGANPNIRSCWHWTALHYARFCDNLANTKALLKAGANPNLRDENGKRPKDLSYPQKDKRLIYIKDGKKSKQVFPAHKGSRKLFYI